MLLAVASAAPAQQDAKASTSDKDLQVSPEQTPSFTKQVNLVLVPVVVRDKKGNAVGSLDRDDFKVFDDGKLESISNFSIETHPRPGEPAHQNPLLGNLPIDKVMGPPPAHFFAYLFDDIHLQTSNLIQVRAAAKKHLLSGMAPDDRAAVFTTSGAVALEFTNDKLQLAQAMDRIKAGLRGGGAQCPYMNYYLAQRIITETSGFDGDSAANSGRPAWDGATDDTWRCMFDRAEHLEPKAREMALAAARREVQIGDANSRLALLTIETLVRHLAAMPGARTLVLVSPGFQTGDDHLEQDTAITFATERNVVINALDARGLYTEVAGADTGSGPSTPLAAQLEDPINLQGLLLQTNVMAELADGTGGKFFRDNNDLFDGFNQLASPPEYVYVLVFKPENLKRGGRYHVLKVVLAKKHGFTVHARRGYLESSSEQSPEKVVVSELQQALFSRDEMRSFPITLKLGYSQKDETNRELSVIANIGLSGIRFHKVKNVNVDDLTLVCGVFDINGNYLQGKKREISLRLTDDVLKQSADGMNITTAFDVKPGAYLIRVVVRDSGDQLLSEVNGTGLIQ